MTTQSNPDETPSRPIEEEGEKVTGGSDAAATPTQEEATQTDPANGGETIPHEESKKEDMTGYNEHPDQEKVGGG